MNKKVAFIAEIVWLVLFVGSLVYGVYETINKGFSNSYMLLIISLFSGLVYLYRRNQRKNQSR
jgi:hypothetical protein